ELPTAGSFSYPDPEVYQRRAELLEVLKPDCPQIKLQRGLHIDGPIIDENALSGVATGNSQGVAVDVLVRLDLAEVAGGQERFEDGAEPEGPHPMLVQLARLREHEGLEVVRGEGSPGVEDGFLDVRLETEPAGLEGRFHHAVAGMKIATVEPKSLDGPVAGRRVPGVGQEHAADVEKESKGLGHLNTPLECNPDQTASSRSRN